MSRYSRAIAVTATLMLMTTACSGSVPTAPSGGGAGGGIGGGSGGAAAAGGGAAAAVGGVAAAAGGAAAAAGGVVVTTRIVSCHVDYGEGFNQIPVTAGDGQIRGTLSISCDDAIESQSITIGLYSDGGKGGQLSPKPVAVQTFTDPGQEQQTLRVYAPCVPGQRWALGFSGSLTARGTQTEPLSGLSNPPTPISDAQCRGPMP